MKIGVISDTHLRRPSALLEEVVARHFAEAPLILHAGDICSREVLSVFSGKELHVVSGNRDDRAVREAYPNRKVIEVEGRRIALLHGWGSPFRAERRMGKGFEGVDCVVFGHTHRPLNRVVEGVLYFNPGSFYRGPFSLWRRSIGILSVVKGGIRGAIIPLPARKERLRSRG